MMAAPDFSLKLNAGGHSAELSAAALRETFE